MKSLSQNLGKSPVFVSQSTRSHWCIQTGPGAGSRDVDFSVTDCSVAVLDEWEEELDL